MIEKFDANNKWIKPVDGQRFIDQVFLKAARVVEGDCYEYRNTHGYVRTYEGRKWFIQTRRRHALHPAVYDMMGVYRPDDWQQLLLEWPHRSVTDTNRLAYNRDEKSAMHNDDCDIKAVITTIGKYLRRHFSHAPDDMIRDIAAQYTYGGGIELVTDLDAMIKAVINGPSSCMSKSFDILCDDNIERHPYAVYDPSLGWGMVIRSDPHDGVLGRCLVWHDKDNDEKMFVRSYKRERGEHSHSGADEAIETWLKQNGYDKRRCWPDGTPIMEYRLRRDDGWLMPYIDGGTQNVSSGRHFCIDCDGDIDANNTDGRAHEKGDTCTNCGARYDREDVGGYVGAYEDEHVCQSCIDDDYTYVYGRRGNQYYVPNGDAIEVDGEYYHDSYLSDNNIVELHDGEYAHIDNAVYIQSEDAYYHVDDDDICYAEDTREYDIKDNCWQCTESGNWYTDDEDYVEIDGDKYHPDNAPETEDQDESGAAA